MSDVLDPQVLRSLREARGWDQLTLATMADVDPSVVSRLERGLQQDLKASVLVALARALETPVDVLLMPSSQHAPALLVAELTAVITELAALPQAQQRQVAAIVRAYLSAMPE
jgi:transcriptional regulator with XRE-family HTH domain